MRFRSIAGWLAKFGAPSAAQLSDDGLHVGQGAGRAKRPSAPASAHNIIIYTANEIIPDCVEGRSRSCGRYPTCACGPRGLDLHLKIFVKDAAYLRRVAARITPMPDDGAAFRKQRGLDFQEGRAAEKTGDDHLEGKLQGESASRG